MSTSASGSATATLTSTHSACSRRGVPPTLPRHPRRRPPTVLLLPRHRLHRSRRSLRPRRLLRRLRLLLLLLRLRPRRHRRPPRPRRHQWPPPPAAPRALRPVTRPASSGTLGAGRLCRATRTSAERRATPPPTKGRVRSRRRSQVQLVERRSAASRCLRRRASLERAVLEPQAPSLRGRCNQRLATDHMRLCRPARFVRHRSTSTEAPGRRARSVTPRTAVPRPSVRRARAGSRWHCSS
jgi:hypothetical protein